MTTVHSATRFIGTILLSLGLSTAALAQPVPDQGQVAAGVEFGAFLPSDDQLSTGWTGGGLIEFYLSPRVSVRGSLGAIRTGYDRDDNDSEGQVRLGGDVLYNWEGGQVHPFVGAGVGLHWLRFYRDGRNEGPNDTKLGMSILGGAEFFLSREWTVKGEARYQFVRDRPSINPDGLALTIGIKRYF